MKIKTLVASSLIGLSLFSNQANADLTVRERNFAIGGAVIGALAANAMSGPSMPVMPLQPMPQMAYAPTYYNQAYYQPPVQVINQCEVRHYRHGYIQDCMPRGAYRITPPVIHYPTPYHMPPPNINFIYSR